jgi:hypothetical protein
LPQALALYNAAPEKLGTGIAIARPPRAAGSSSGIQLAGHDSTAPADRGVTPASFAEVAVDEFLPPITRPRAVPPIDVTSETADDPPLAFPSVSETPDAQPPPFPAANRNPVDAQGWSPSN